MSIVMSERKGNEREFPKCKSPSKVKDNVTIGKGNKSRDKGANKGKCQYIAIIT